MRVGVLGGDFERVSANMSDDGGDNDHEVQGKVHVRLYMEHSECKFKGNIACDCGVVLWPAYVREQFVPFWGPQNFVAATVYICEVVIIKMSFARLNMNFAR